MTIARVAGHEGMEAVVSQIGAAFGVAIGAKRFSVAVRDTESGEFFPSIRIFSDLDTAMTYALTIAPKVAS